MANENTPKQQSSVDNTPDTTTAKTTKKGAAKDNKARVGGSAVPGAKSTQPKQMPTGNNQQDQQAANSNRLMRRRMERMGTYDTEKRMQNVYNQRRKRIERRKQKLEEARAEVRKSSPAGRIRLGRGNIYFIVGVVVLILIVILFAVLRSMHII